MMVPIVDTRHPNPKRELLEALLERGMVMVTLDARAPGVDVPARFREDRQLSLNLSYRFGLSLEVDDDGVRATLTFGGVPHGCAIPWSALYQVRSHESSEAFVFSADVPDDLVYDQEDLPAPVPSPRGKGRLSVVAPPPPDDEGSSPPASGSRDAEAPIPRGSSGGTGGSPARGHLRRIK